MDKLTIRELAPYLPYKLQMIFDGKGGRVIELTGITDQGKHGLTITNGHGGMWLESCGFEPLLFPLSNLTKEIEVNGERFVPIDYNAFKKSKQDIIEFQNKFLHYKALKYGIMERLLEWHFDVFGLIERGLAIDKTTINRITND
jgi:hypothetical protein